MGLWQSDVKKVEIKGLEEWDEKRAVQDGEKKISTCFPHLWSSESILIVI